MRGGEASRAGGYVVVVVLLMSSQFSVVCHACRKAKRRSDGITSELSNWKMSGGWVNFTAAVADGGRFSRLSWVDDIV